MAILIAGFPYIRSSYRDTFKEYPGNEQIFFLLPEHWPIKNGAVVFHAPSESNIISARAFFAHSNYPVIGGLLKGWMPSFPLALYKLNRQEDVDLVYSCSEPILLTTLYQAVWTKIFGCRHIFFSWENIPYENKFSGLNLFLKKIILRLNIALSDGIICGNTKGREILNRYTTKPIQVIPMSGVDTDFFQRTSAVEEFQGRNFQDKIVFTFAGAIGHRKGLSYLIEAFVKLQTKVPNAFLIIAGSGEYQDKLEGLIKASGLSDSIFRIPWLEHEQLRELLNISDVFVYPSISHGGWQEQFGYSMAEASLMELPVISTSSGSITDVVISEQTGLIVPEKDSEALYQAMLKLALDDDSRLKLGKNGRAYIVNQYSHKAIAQKFSDFFREIIS
jgi:glycosyltransferase involved in cell wall biosynthesis